MNKYGAVKTWSNLCGCQFDSKAECRRGEELHLLMMAGEIQDLTYQHTIPLFKKPKVTITIDFVYKEKGKFDRWIYEDTKGVLTAEFRVKLCWLKEKFDIDVKLSGKGRDGS